MRIVSICLLLLTMLCPVEAQSLMRDWLIAMPDSVMPLLTKNNRLDFVDFHDCGMEAKVTNLLDGKSSMDTLTDDYVHINYTKTTTVDMKLLAVNDTTEVLCMVTTVKSSVEDSRIAFFDSQWCPLGTSAFFKKPNMDDFRLAVQGDSAELAWAKMDIFFRTYHLAAGEETLKCEITSMDFLSDTDRMDVNPYVRKEPIVYRWNNGKFMRDE